MKHLQGVVLYAISSFWERWTSLADLWTQPLLELLVWEVSPGHATNLAQAEQAAYGSWGRAGYLAPIWTDLPLFSCGVIVLVVIVVIAFPTGGGINDKGGKSKGFNSRLGDRELLAHFPDPGHLCVHLTL